MSMEQSELFSPEPPQRPPHRANTSSRLLLGIAIGCGGMLLLCCGGVIGSVWFMQNLVAQAFHDDPQVVERTLAEIAEIKIPPQFEPKGAVLADFPIVGLLGRFVIYKTKEGDGGLMLGDYNSDVLPVTPDEFAEQMRFRVELRDRARRDRAPLEPAPKREAPGAGEPLPPERDEVPDDDAAPADEAPDAEGDQAEPAAPPEPAPPDAEAPADEQPEPQAQPGEKADQPPAAEDDAVEEPDAKRPEPPPAEQAAEEDEIEVTIRGEQVTFYIHQVQPDERPQDGPRWHVTGTWRGRLGYAFLLLDVPTKQMTREEIVEMLRSIR